MTMRPADRQDRQAVLQISGLALGAFVCGACIRIKFDLVGELYLVEPLVLLLAVQCLLSRGLGKRFVPSVFFSFVGAGLVTLFGYLLADLMAANEPWQYLKGWGRVGLLILDCVALIVLAAHGRRNVWWFALGVAVGGLAALAAEGVPVTQWKLGYGEYVAILLLALAGLLPGVMGSVLVGAFGAFCILADYRSLGAVCLLVAAILVYRALGGGGGQRGSMAGWIGLATVGLFALAALATALISTEDRFAERRQLSNVGRYAGLVVAWRAITESPIVGYGSWASEERFTRMLRNEVRRAEGELQRTINTGRSLLPHSQFLQSWIEGGLLGIAFFALYGIRMIGAARWFGLARPVDAITATGLFFLLLGMWNLVASPFLGYMRINIAIAVAFIAVAAYERGVAGNAPGFRGVRNPPGLEAGASKAGSSPLRASPDVTTIRSIGRRW